FHLLCDEVSQLDWAVALKQLIDLIEDIAQKANKKITKLIKTQLQQWIMGLPSYIKGYLPNLSCES
ncbi:IS4 family transposase, partial [Brevibacillus invocatus]